ncbi:MAG: hypothetical protein ABI612_13195 [Betaproteobacteria bacterium]
MRCSHDLVGQHAVQMTAHRALVVTHGFQPLIWNNANVAVGECDRVATVERLTWINQAAIRDPTPEACAADIQRGSCQGHWLIEVKRARPL